jgi:hypothetical protein
VKLTVAMMNLAAFVSSGIRENQLRLKREMDGLRDELFAREDEEAITVDDAHVVTDGETASIESEAKRAWDWRSI